MCSTCTREAAEWNSRRIYFTSNEIHVGTVDRAFHFQGTGGRWRHCSLHLSTADFARRYPDPCKDPQPTGTKYAMLDSITFINTKYRYPDPHKNPLPTSTKYAMLGEFGGIGAFVLGRQWVPGKCYAYKKARRRYCVLLCYCGSGVVLLW